MNDLFLNEKIKFLEKQLAEANATIDDYYNKVLKDADEIRTNDTWIVKAEAKLKEQKEALKEKNKIIAKHTDIIVNMRKRILQCLK